MPEWRVDEPETERLQVLMENLIFAAEDAVVNSGPRELPARAVALRQLYEADQHRLDGDFGKAVFGMIDAAMRPRFKLSGARSAKHHALEIAEVFEIALKDSGKYESAMASTTQELEVSKATVDRARRVKAALDETADERNHFRKRLVSQ